MNAPARVEKKEFTSFAPSSSRISDQDSRGRDRRAHLSGTWPASDTPVLKWFDKGVLCQYIVKRPYNGWVHGRVKARW